MASVSQINLLRNQPFQISDRVSQNTKCLDGCVIQACLNQVEKFGAVINYPCLISGFNISI